MGAEPRQQNGVSVSGTGSGRLTVTGDLTFATAREAREAGLRSLAAAGNGELVVDCSGVTGADSAGLAVLLEWLAWARRNSRVVTYENLPASLLAVARISEVDELLQG